MALKIKCDDGGVVELLPCSCGSRRVTTYRDAARFDFEANAADLCEAAKRLREAADLIEAVAGRL